MGAGVGAGVAVEPGALAAPEPGALSEGGACCAWYAFCAGKLRVFKVRFAAVLAAVGEKWGPQYQVTLQPLCHCLRLPLMRMA